MGLSQRDYAAHRKAKGLRGTTLKAVQDALAAGRIRRGTDGKINPDDADRLWEERTIIRVAQRPQRAGKPQRRFEGEAEGKAQSRVARCKPSGTRSNHVLDLPTEPENEPGNDDNSFFEAQRQREWTRLEKEKIELEARRCELVALVPINAYVAGMIIKAREQFTRIGPELRDRLAQETDPIACEAMISNRILRALNEMAEYGPPAE